MMVCILISVTFTFKNIFIYLNRYTMNFINFSITKDMRSIVYKHILTLPINFFHKNKSGKVISIIVNDLNQINRSITDSLSSLVMEPLRLILFISMLMVINVKLTLVIFTLYPILAFIIVKIGQSVKRKVSRQLETFAGLVSILSETVMGVKAVKMFNMNETEYKKFNDENNNFRKKALKSKIIEDIPSPLTETLAVYIITSLLWFGGGEVLNQNSSFTAEDFMRFLFYLFLSYQPLKTMGKINNIIQSGIAASERVFTILDTEGEPINPVNPEKVPPFTESILFDKVTFSYPECKEVVLNNLSFEAKKGEVVAIVGSSGAGKTTILDILPRFYELEKGRILLDGKDVESHDLAAYRELFGIVSQDTILFNDSIRANIAYGQHNATEEKIIEAAKASYAFEFIEKMHEGSNSIIREPGVTLSGGQR